MKKALHVGCGTECLPSWFGEVEETRLDMDKRVKPDVVAPMTRLGEIGPFDFLYTSHALEHLYPHQVHTALTEFLRVLRKEGAVIIFVPDLEDVKPTTEMLYKTSHGLAICGNGLIYGHHLSVKSNPLGMAHHSGFTCATLGDAMKIAGFRNVEIKRLENYNLMATGIK